MSTHIIAESWRDATEIVASEDIERWGYVHSADHLRGLRGATILIQRGMVLDAEMVRNLRILKTVGRCVTRIVDVEKP